MSNKNMFLYWGSGSAPCWKAMIVLAEKGLWQGLPNKLLEWSKDEHKAETVLKLNPRGQLPTFRDGDVVVNESSAICLYLEDKYSSESNRLMPTNPDERAAVYQNIFEWSNYFANVMSILDYKYEVPVMSWDSRYIKECYIKANRELQIWEKKLTISTLFHFGKSSAANPHGRSNLCVLLKLICKAKDSALHVPNLGLFKGKEYLVGDKFSMADVIFYPSIAVTIRMGACLEKSYPALQSYYLRISERPSVKATRPPHWSEGPSHGMLHALCDECYQ